ncbi:hypothetical protein NEIG_00964 [Nematocida sp. ERTm5]|nr:hypothetical protein NEIRO02_0376 [Nematocida sp. AWRm79]KAI5182729.1 hypothetical protein NEIRO03_0380 [Nematocida sp. AWRm78]OAG33409.1 hypothetical protein NEIG_00964 [Nematocida sp. ERTm5]
MNHIIEELKSVKKAAESRTNTLNKSKISKRMKYDILLQILEDSLSKVHCKYMLDITNSIMCNAPINKILHTELTRTLELFEKTKKEVLKTIKRTGKDPITDDYIGQVVDILQYSVE